MERQLIDLRDVKISGRILDIGGGGEGVIARCFGNNVIAIDRRRDELEESPDVGIKIVMDARELMFLDNFFDNVTCFYSMMYMPDETTCKALAEAYRVIKTGGFLWIWDAVMPVKFDDEVYIAHLDVVLPGEQFMVDYGVGWHRGQSLEDVTALCESAGFKVVEKTEVGESMFVKAVKI